MGKLMSYREWRERRNQASILIGYVIHAARGKKREAWRVYNEWRRGKLTFSEAERKLRSITGLNRP